MSRPRGRQTNRRVLQRALAGSSDDLAVETLHCLGRLVSRCPNAMNTYVLGYTPVGRLVPPTSCARLVLVSLFMSYSWRRPAQLLGSLLSLHIAVLCFEVLFLIVSVLAKWVFLGRHRAERGFVDSLHPIP